MEISDVLTLLIHGNQLKRTARTGWVQRGVAGAENVAAHSYGTAFVALVMVEVIPQPLALQRVLVMALLHDLPEGLTTDIPAPTWRMFPPGVKDDVENSAMQQIFADLPFKQNYLNYWEELQKNETAEAHLVHDCDKLDMYLQAWMYEQQTGNQQLEEFWKKEHKFEFEEVQALYEEITRLRP
ncbi:MAG: HD domain-containing protein [Candidatus Promineifilaceae bacterium]